MINNRCLNLQSFKTSISMIRDPLSTYLKAENIKPINEIQLEILLYIFIDVLSQRFKSALRI